MSAESIANTLLRIGEIQGRGFTDAANARARALEITGDAQARATAANGQIWGQTLASLGQIPGQVMQQVQQQKTQALENTQRDLMNKRAQAVLQGDQAATQIMGSMPKNSDGTIDLSDMSRMAGWSKMLPEQQSKFLETATALNAHTAAANQSKIDHAADAADTILKQAQRSGEPLSIEGASMALGWARDAGLVPQDFVDKAHQALTAGADPTALFTAFRNQGSKYKTQQPIKLGAGDTLVDPTSMKPILTAPEEPGKGDYTINGQRFKGDGTPIGQTVPPQVPAPRPAAPPQTGSFPDYMTRKYGPNPTPDQVIEGRKAYGQADDRPSVTIAQTDQAAKDVKETVSGMADGSIPPILPSRASKEYTALMAEAHRQGVNLVKANEDWNATQKYLGTLNGQQQVRLRQAVAFTKDSLPVVESLAQEWDAGKFPLLNKANLALAKNGAFGQKAASLATKLDAQISDLTSELGTVYKGGNSSTDESLALAAKNLSANWSKQTLLDNVKQIRQNLQIRENSIRGGSPVANDGNIYAPKTGDTTAAPATGASAGRQRVVGPNGESGTVPAGTALPPGWKVQ